ncbi:ammonia transport outward protein 3 [Monosporozyma servazzii]
MTNIPSSSSEMEKSQSIEVSSQKVDEIFYNKEYITLGDHTYRRSDLLTALGPDLANNNAQSADAYPQQSKFRKLANPVPLGLASFSLSCMTLSLINANVRGVTNVKLLISLFMFFGGAIELFAGLLCFVTGDTYAMTVFSSFGGFWISWGCINTDQFHSITGYGEDTQMLNNAIGFFLAGWTVFTFLMLMCTLKSSWGLFLLLTFLDLTFLLLCIGSFIDDNNVKMAGGYFGILSSCCGWYSLYCMVVNDDNSYFSFRATMMPNAPIV